MSSSEYEIVTIPHEEMSDIMDLMISTIIYPVGGIESYLSMEMAIMGI
jgi:hypothetical protein